MNFSVFNTKLCTKMLALGLSIPAEDIADYELPEEDTYKVYRNQFMKSKAAVLQYLAMKNDTLCNKLYSSIEDMNLIEDIDGYWHYEVEEDNNAIRLKLIKARGFVDDDLDFVIEEIENEYTLFQVAM